MPRLRKDQWVEVKVQGKTLLMVEVQGEVLAFESRCPHEGYPLKNAKLEKGTLTCPMHGYCYSIKTGALIQPETGNKLITFPVKVEDGTCFIKI